MSEQGDKPAPSGGGRKQCHCEEGGGAPEWLISYADNVSLLMAFFVILLAMNLKVDTSGGIGGKEEFGGTPSIANLDLALAIRAAFNNPVSVHSTVPSEQRLVQRLRERQQAESDGPIQPGPRGQNPQAQSLRPTDYYTPSGTVQFALGSSELTAAGHAEVAQIAGEIRDVTYIIEVRGHASPFEVFRNEREGMHLSFERALAVADALASMGIPWDNMHIVACSDGPPLPDRARTRQEAERSQVVEVVTTAQPVQPRPLR